MIVTKTNVVEIENKSNCTEWTPEISEKYIDETFEQTQECDIETVDTYSYSINGNVIEQKDLNGTSKKIFEQQAQGTKSLIFNSCKEIFDAGRSIGNGDYSLNVNGSNKNVYCDMSEGGWTLYDEFDSTYFSKNPYNATIDVHTQLNAAGYTYSASSFKNTYESLNVNLTNGFKLFFRSGTNLEGFLQKNIAFNGTLKVIYGNPFNTSTCNVFINNILKQSSNSNSQNIFIHSVNIGDIFKISEIDSVCSIDSIWFK